MKALGVLGLLVGFALGIVALAGFVAGGVLSVIVPEELAARYEALTFVLVFGSGGLGCLAWSLWRRSHRFVSKDADPELTLIIVVGVLMYGGAALFVLWIILRYTGVLGPLVTEKGL